MLVHAAHTTNKANTDFPEDIELLKVSYAQKSCDVAKKFAFSGMMFDI